MYSLAIVSVCGMAGYYSQARVIRLQSLSTLEPVVAMRRRRTVHEYVFGSLARLVVVSVGVQATVLSSLALEDLLNDR